MDNRGRSSFGNCKSNPEYDVNQLICTERECIKSDCTMESNTGIDKAEVHQSLDLVDDQFFR